MTIFGYARVSSDGQTLNTQIEALKAAGCKRIFREKIGGAPADRGRLTKLLARVATGDVLIVTRLDRLARSTRDLINVLGGLAERGAAFRSLGDPWADTTTPHGRLMLTVLGGLAEFERELIRARTGDGRARAKARGVHMGRPSALTQHQRQEASKALSSGAMTQADLARQLNVSQSTISRLANQTTPAPIGPKLDAATLSAAQAFLGRLKGKYAPLHALVYGSRARGDHKPDSDADIAVILKGRRGNRYKAVRDMSDAAYDVLMETGIHIQPLPLWEGELERPEQFGNPSLIETIKREGLRF